MRSRILASALVLGLGLVIAEPISASGSYRSRPPGRSVVDPVRYNLGKDLFLGRIDPSAGQQAMLQKILAKLPEEARGEAKLDGLAGKLSADELASLVHYAAVTYGLEDLDPEKLALGQELFEGQGDVADEAGPTARLQADRLAVIDAEIPAESRPARSLTSLAGRLTYDQLEALEHYTAVAFKSTEIARHRYRVGERLFRGERQGEGADAGVAEEAKQLAALEAQLPESARAKADLSSLAGKLTPAQIDALHYYLVVRYKLR